MPLYEYQCEACGNRFERIQKFSDPPVEVCPACGGAVRKLVSSPAFQFKGTGWYVTDYAKPATGGEAASKDAKDAPAAKVEGDASAGKSGTTEKSEKADKSSDTSKAEKTSDAKPKA